MRIRQSKQPRGGIRSTCEGLRAHLCSERGGEGQGRAGEERGLHLQGAGLGKSLDDGKL